MKKTSILAGLVLALGMGTAHAQLSDDKIKIAVMSDFTTNFAEVGGEGSVAAAKMAIEDFGGTLDGKPIEVISADHANKPDNASAIARRWYDEEGVDMIIDVPASAAALAVQNVARERNKIVIYSSASTDVLTNDQCSPTGIHWTYDAYAVGKALARALAKKDSTWYFVTVDTAGGTGLQNAATPFIEAAGGKVVGSVRHPQASADMASFLLQAQTSGAQFVALGNAGTDLVNAAKQAGEFGITPAQTLVAIVMFMSDLRALGLEAGQDLTFVTAFEPTTSPEAAAWAKRYSDAMGGKAPNDVHAGVYSATLAYLNAIRAAGTDEGPRVVEQMRATPVDDIFAKGGKLREDGRMVHDVYLVQAKKPSESAGDHDLVKLLEVIPGEDAFRPLSESTCPLVKK